MLTEINFRTFHWWRWPWRQATLTNQGLLGLFLMLMAFALSASVYIFVHFSDRIAESYQENLRVIALSKKALVENYLQERRQDIEVLAKREPIWQTLQSEGSLRDYVVNDQLGKLLGDFSTIYGYRDLRLLDASLNFVGGIKTDPASSEQKLAIKKSLSDKTTELVSVHLDADGERVFGFTAPVFRDGRPMGAPIGALYLELSAASKIDNMIAGWPGASLSAEVLLIENDGDHVQFLNRPKFVKENLTKGFFRYTKTPTLISATLLTAPENAFLRGVDYRGKPVIGAGVAIAGTPWHLLAKMDLEEVNESVHWLGWSVVVAFTTLLLILAGTGWFYWRLRSTEIVAAEAALGAHYLAAQKTSIDGYVSADEAGTILESNAALEKMTGYSSQELNGKGLAELSAEFSPIEFSKKLAAIRSEGTSRFRTRFYKKDGSFLNVDANVTFIETQKGGSFHGFIKDINQELSDQIYIKRLNAFYLFLSKVNAEIFNAKSTFDMLAVVCDAAVNYGGFNLAWAGTLDRLAGRIVPNVARGTAARFIDDLVITTGLDSPTRDGPAAQSVLERRVIELNDLQNQPVISLEKKIALDHDLNSTAAVPILFDKEVVATICFYATEKHFFDAEVRALLEEVSINTSHAWRAINVVAQRNVAIKAREESEVRFAKLLDAAPIPIQIHDRQSLEMRLFNNAHKRVFGYALEDIRDENQWFELAYPDPVVASQMRDLWRNNIGEMVVEGESAVRSSPELTLRCKDGSTRIMRGYGTVVADDVIVLWQDLTEIKQAMNALERNEKRFRGMIEQTLTGIYVTQNNAIVYANPRLCELIGWTEAELLGRDSLEVFGDVPEGRKKILSGRAKLASGVRSVFQEVPIRTRDGRDMMLGSHASEGLWDGQSANFILCQDVTEKLAENEKIAAYTRQLEFSMKGTLQAVATMLDFRDPYTSGHERRVGLVAAEIAREMGWSEDRCRNLELVGLVHDIGKIAVPAEILSKPTRLTKLEFDMVKAHAEKGYEILKDVIFPLPVAEIIREHHERLDGSGYPRGLRGEQILPEARVLAVADVLESMSSHRPYRPALGIEAALHEIESHRGLWFDEQVVDALLRLVREKSYQLPA